MIEALFPRTKRRVLELLFCNPESKYYLREISRVSGTKLGALQRELGTLTKAGIIETEVRGSRRYYWANRGNPIFEELQSIVRKTSGVVDEIRDALKTFRGKIDLAFVFGSMATGEATGKSDVDLMVIGRLSLKELTVALNKVQQFINREINTVLYGREEFNQLYQSKNHFIRTVSDSPVRYVIGSEDVFRNLVAEPKAKGAGHKFE